MIQYHSFITTKEPDNNSKLNTQLANVLVVEDRGDRLRFRSVGICTTKEQFRKSKGFATISFYKGKIRCFHSDTDENGKAVSTKECDPSSLITLLNVHGTDTLTMIRGCPVETYQKDNAVALTRLLVETAHVNRVRIPFEHRPYLDWKEPPLYAYYSRYGSEKSERHLPPPTALFMMLYPAFGELINNAKVYVELPHRPNVEGPVFQALKSPSVEEFVDKVFPGKSTRNTRKLITDVMFPEGRRWEENGLDFLEIVSKVSDNLLIDHIHTVLRARAEKLSRDHKNSLYYHYNRGISSAHKQGIVLLSQMVDSSKLCSLLEEWQAVAAAENMFLDTLQMLTQNGEPLKIEGRLRGVNDLHDKVTMKNLELSFRSKPIPLPRKVLDLNGAEINGMKLMIPDKTLQLAIWSSKMHNCIRTYADSAANRRIILMGLYAGENIVYNGMIERSYDRYNPSIRITQFYGPRNTSPKPEDSQAFRTWVQENEEVLLEGLKDRY